MSPGQYDPQTAANQDGHSRFAWLYESFLDSAYGSSSHRCKLVQSIMRELATRGVKTILDCAAGTGFPAIDLAKHNTKGQVRVHCTDADLDMLEVFEARVKDTDGINLRQFSPPRKLKLGSDSASSLRLAWHELAAVRRTYDYVMCRGNSLAYANTWSGGRTVSSADAIGAYIQEMAKRVRPGGYLHLDAPRTLELPEQLYPSVSPGGVTISEQVTNEPDCRHWKVAFELPSGVTLQFDRYSTLLTIADVQEMLEELGFQETGLVSLDGERPGFGVIIAQKPPETDRVSSR